VFNAAVIILLNQLAFVDPNSHDTADISLATSVFEQEAALGNNFGIDCARVLHELSSLVQALRDRPNPISQPVVPGSPPHMNGQLKYDPMYMSNASGDVNGHAVMPPLNGDDSLQRELQAWLDHDYLQLYNDYLI
jgi:hypothetical protein